MIRRLVLALAWLVVLVAVAGRWRVSLWPDPYEPAATAPAGSLHELRVAYHVHTRRSDGTGRPEDVASAAWEAGLDAVILTDHGDGTRTADPPRRIHGVLVVDAAEISTWGGHYVALGARPSPYPLGGEPEAVVEDVARLGGLGIAAHPGSAKADLKWRGWDAPFDGVEWLNADSEWRDRPRDLWAAVPAYPWAPAATIASLLDRPVAELREWDRRAARRPTVGVAAHDAHARLGLRGVGEPYDGAVALRAPGYAAMFRAFSNVVLVEGRDWGRDDAHDAAALVAAIGAGRTYTVVTGHGHTRVKTFTASSGAATAGMGGYLAALGPVRVEADVDAPPSATTTLVCDGRPVAGARGGRLTWTSSAPPGACRLEVSLDGDASRMPWVVTNPIYARPVLVLPGVHVLAEPQLVMPVPGSGDAAGWTSEASADARSEIAPAADQPRRALLRWRLGAQASTYAAASFRTPGDFARFDRLVLRAFADRPMRVWVQLRSAAGGGQRWGRSVYLDTTPRAVTLPLASFLPMDGQAGQQAPLAEISTLLLVADTVHARPGDRGVVTFDEWWMAR